MILIAIRLCDYRTAVTGSEVMEELWKSFQVPTLPAGTLLAITATFPRHAHYVKGLVTQHPLLKGAGTRARHFAELIPQTVCRGMVGSSAQTYSGHWDIIWCH
jgi:hypothetical protein